jgi:DNA invertase Pin-like site-specific DNA recombinase
LDQVTAPLRAAEYIRMSTDLQVYSPLNQAAAIGAFAASHGVAIIRSYRDEGCSGLDLAGRPALRRLLDDVNAGHADFSMVLVYDVSRWGRFQNADEAAYYEFVCLRAGIRVHYVAEPFDNDDTPLSAILKGLKRTMAAEYSRELSVRVSAGQARIASMGFHAGGLAGFGLRRMLVDSHGRRKGELGLGERKSLTTDRVILVPGPKAEIAIVRRIFRQSAAGYTLGEIAKGLNQAGVRTHKGRAWRYDTVGRILVNEKYLGHVVYRKTTRRLRGAPVPTPPEQWVRHPRAFAPLVSKAAFRAARRVPSPRISHQTDEQLLADLRALLAREGRLNVPLISAEPGLFCARVYAERFGGLRRLYERVGFKPPKNLDYADARRRSRGRRESLTAFTADLLREEGSQVVRDRWCLRVDDAWTVSFTVLPSATRDGTLSWHLKRPPEPTSIVVFARMPAGGRAPVDYLVLPRLLFSEWRPVFRERLGHALESFAFDSLAVLRDLAQLSRMAPTACS